MTEDGVIADGGVIEYRDETGRLDHADGPARVFPSGREEWFRCGRLHRGDGAAVLVKYYRGGVRHREGSASLHVYQWYREWTEEASDTARADPPRSIPTSIWFIDGVKVREEGRSSPVYVVVLLAIIVLALIAAAWSPIFAVAIAASSLSSFSARWG